MGLYKNIQDACKSAGVTIIKMESDLNFSRGSVCKWDDHTPSIDKVGAVADYLKVSIDDLRKGTA